MQSNELKLKTPCRFCGIFPKIEINSPKQITIIEDCNCLHLHAVGITFTKTSKSETCENMAEDIEKYWNARNEKHNPFVEIKHD